MSTTEIEESKPLQVSMWEDNGTEHEVTAWIRRIRFWFDDGTGWSPWTEQPLFKTATSGVTRREDGAYLLVNKGLRLRTRAQLPPDFFPG
ncbi:MAG: hypothetical protein V4505_09755 [Pseudomonadota bacterium]